MSTEPASMPSIRAPFTAAQVATLNDFQQSGTFHPFTCANRGEGHEWTSDLGVLVATETGWICPSCDYTQNWAWAAMAERPARWVTCQYRSEPHVLDDECVDATDVPWVPGAGVARIKATLPGLMPELTDEDFAKADLLIAAARRPGESAVEQAVRERDSLARRLGVRFGEIEQLRGEMAQLRDERDVAYARGISEGRRQAAEGSFGTEVRDLGDDYREAELAHGRWYFLDDLGVRVMVALAKPYTVLRWKPLGEASDVH